jgi:cytochrome c oxidase assembly protein subunit 11
MNAAIQQQNRQMMGKLLVIVVGMLGFAFAMVPMYRQICDALGINATRVLVATNTQVDTSRSVTVELLAGSAQGLQWPFEALDRAVTLHPGELRTVRYRVTNNLGRPVTAHASMSVAPMSAARYLKKTECFCFTNQTLAAGETREMPVTFYVDREAPADIGTITLSYTFFDVSKAAGAT